jgi:fermentation-respiration switch protein FrsA (DUF1100 family)
MRLSRAVLSAALAVTATGLAGAVGTSSADAVPPPYTVQTLHFAVQIGPNLDQPCDIVGDLYTPRRASSTNRVPAILTTNGFGGSKDDQAGIGKAFSTRGYEVLSYSGLGFGGSDCKITLDDPDYDGQAARQLVSFLGGASGIAFTDDTHSTPVAPLDVVQLDAVDHDGNASAFDPRVGMVGGSYGGGIQFAAASVDPRIDTIVPLITWNDLSYSLGPNNTAQTVGVSSSTPGAIKLSWGLLFSADGIADGLGGGVTDPARLYGCPNFANFVCTALVSAGTTGYFQDSDVQALRHASVASFMSRIHIPTLLVQGENDTLFNLNEAAATYQALQAQGTAVKMIWQSWGHSQSTPAPGELSLANPDPATQYETKRISAWFAHYLRDKPVSTGPQFAYFRDWIDYTGIATPAYAKSSSFPVGRAQRLFLNGNGTLATSRSALVAGSQTFTTPPAGAPTSLDPVDVVGSYSPTQVADQDAPGTFASWTGAPLAADLDVAGSPAVTVSVSAPTAAATQGTGPAGQLVLFAKIADVAPDGTATLINGLVAPVRIPDVTAPIQIRLPGIVHRFAAGHSIRLVLAGGAVNYRGGLTPTPVTIAGGSAGQVLSLPVVG